ncbi:hypothetical protein TCAL_10947 [Tigriopus californicus]|uniref:C2H2-type domain-containing protein n=1 Tax=Tigriopus californicus TaxID=6832 RepID=A0A553NC85_TIGCA|nr:zinc finger protein 60-like [Tigriopus californicus]TRY62979.1 hypothetical protein TCAL_10947 [Tigriopus californicus]|eukprot:TCALIF_10947-PA protein Name:"Similar to ZNF624 Zinc finger protein 624 (Homo sapiens)" AED:0.17 eAED:0.17 QI:0/-1/0/1/-1/1/1/0/782
MDQGVELVQKLQSSIPSPKLLYFVMDDWLLVHKNSFDHFNEDGEPFISQVFLIEIKTGRYIHRCQGQKVDHGTAIELQVLTAKLTHAFQGTKPCLGFFIQEDSSDDVDPLSSTTVREFPFRRQTSRDCQFHYKVPSVKSEKSEDRKQRCSPCQVLWQEIHSSPLNPSDTHLDGSDIDLQTDAQSIVVDILRIKPENDDVDGPSTPYGSSYDSSEAVRQEIFSKAKEVFKGHNSDGEEDQANLDLTHSLDTMDIQDDLCEDKEVVANKDNPHSMNVSNASDEPSSSIFNIGQSSTTGSEHVCMCCSQPFPSLQALTWHRNMIQCQSKKSNDVDIKSSVPESGSSTNVRRSRNRCLCCSIVFPNNRQLVEHGKERQKEERARRKVGCRECGERPFRTFKELIQHYSIQHPEKVENNQEYLPQSQELETMKEPKTCSICDVVSNGRTLNSRHKEKYHVVGNYLCSTCQEPCLTYYDLMIHRFQAHLKATDSIPISYNGLSTCADEDGKISYKTDGLVCQICSESFKCKKTFASHQRRAHSWGRMRCKPCGEWSNYAQDISAHTLHFHKDKPEVLCPNCDEVIDLKDNPAAFDLHFPTCCPSRAYRRRTLNSPFQCPLCEKKYSLKHSLKAHLKMHQGIFKYQCEYCGFGANVKHTFVRHKNVHLRKMGLLTEADHLRECKVCGKKLVNKEAVYHHMRRVHQEQKPVSQCKQCGESFVYSSALYNHKIRVHGHVPKSKGSKCGKFGSPGHRILKAILNQPIIGHQPLSCEEEKQPIGPKVIKVNYK